MSGPSPLRYALGWAQAKIRSAFTQTVLVRHPAAYEAGHDRRADLGFDPIVLGPNLMADSVLPKVWERCQYLVDNHPLISGAIDTIVSNTCGKTIYAIPSTRWPELNDQFEDLFWAASEAVDIGRERNLQQDQEQFRRQVFATGECLIYHPIAEAFGGKEMGPAIELFPCQQLGIGLNNVVGLPEGRKVRQGVERDSLNRRTGYWLYKSVPMDGGNAFEVAGMTASSLRRLDRRDATLAVAAKKIGQLRGVPQFVSAVLASRDMANHKEANLALAQACASVGLYFTGVKPPTDLMPAGTMNEDRAVDAQGRTIQEMGPGLVGYLPKGAAVNLVGMNVPGPQFANVIKLLTTDMGAGTGLSYGTISRDKSQTTYSASRAEHLDDRRGTFAPGQELIWHWHTRPFYRRVIQFAITTGKVQLNAEQMAAYLTNPEEIFRCEAMFPGWEYIDPQKESSAADQMIRTGTTDRQTACAARGQHWRDVVDRQLAVEKYEMEERKRLGLQPREVVMNPNPTAPAQGDSAGAGTGTSTKPDPNSPAADGEGDGGES